MRKFDLSSFSIGAVWHVIFDSISIFHLNDCLNLQSVSDALQFQYYYSAVVAREA